MIRGIVSLSAVLSLNGCFVLATVLCDDDPRVVPPESDDCAQIEEAGDAADDAVFESLRGPDSDEPVAQIRIEGLVTDDGEPMERAAVRLLLDDDVLLVVRTDAGAFSLETLVDAEDCDELTVQARTPEGVDGGPREVECGDWVLDYDFGTGVWSGG